MRYLYILGTVLFTVYGQLILKWRINIYGDLPLGIYDKLLFLLKLLIDPYIISGFFSAFIAALFWMATMTKFELSIAYPFMSLAFVLVLVLSCYLLGENMGAHKVLGLIFIIVGIIITSR